MFELPSSFSRSAGTLGHASGRFRYMRLAVAARLSGLLCCLLALLALPVLSQQRPANPQTPKPQPQQSAPPKAQAQQAPQPALTEAETAAMLAQLDSMYVAYSTLERYSHRRIIDANHPYAPDDSTIPTFTPEEVAARLAEIEGPLPLDYNPTVQRFIDAYTVRLRNLVSRLVGQQYVYFPIIEEIFEREGVPTELKYLCVIESAFNNRARSRAAAVGLWQFMYGTAKMYRLRIDDYVDERQDPYKSTVAAARYLKHMYAVYKDWHLVIAAYNCGPGRVNRAIRMSRGKRNYWEIIRLLPPETRGYVPSYIAATYALNYYAEHNIRPTWVDFAFEDSIVIRNQELALDDLAAATGTDSQLLRDLNPALRLAKVPYSSEPFVLRVPKTLAEFARQYPDSIARIRPMTAAGAPLVETPESRIPPNARKIRHTVRRGQTYAIIARAYGIEASDLMVWNNAQGTNLEVGQVLVLYKSATTVAKPAAKGAAIPRATAGGSYRVRKGDTLWSIAQKHQITIEQLRRANKMSRTSKILPGQVLKIPR